MKSLLGLLVGIFLTLLLAAFAGESPLHVLEVIVKSAFGSPYDFGLTLFYSTSLVFTGLSVCIAFHAGLFNIGAEGQLTIGAFSMAAFALLFPHLPETIAPVLAILFGLLVAAIWGFIPGILKSFRGSHEVIVTMMMNFVAAGLVSYLTVTYFKNPNSQNPETAEIPSQFFLKQVDPLHMLTKDSPLNFSVFIAIILALSLWIFLFKTVMGYELRVVGQSESVAKNSGINVKFYLTLAMILSALFAGFVGINEVIAFAGKFRLGFSPEFGFIGIAVALLARNNPLYILLSALLFGVLQKGAGDLDFETQNITRDFAKVLQAIIILSVSGFSLFQWKKLGGGLKK